MRWFHRGRRKLYSTDLRSDGSMSWAFVQKRHWPRNSQNPFHAPFSLYSMKRPSSRYINYAIGFTEGSKKAQTPLDLVKFIFVWPHIECLPSGSHSSLSAYLISGLEPRAQASAPFSANTRLANDAPLQGTTSSMRAQQSAWHCHKSTQLPHFLPSSHLFGPTNHSWQSLAFNAITKDYTSTATL